jgi:DNA repair exonuclease SbcCD ATPase subunit
MRIDSVKFRNFGSYGNKWSSIDMTREPMFVLIHGKNGGGKTTISDVIKFAIYGKLENKKLKDIANRINKNMEVVIEITTRNGKIRIERAVEPGHFRLYLDDKEIDKAGKRSVQEYLEEELLEMPFYVFSNTLSLSINDFKSFIRMSNHDKKAIIDKIFGLQVLNTMRDLLKQQTKRLKENVDTLSASAVAFEKSLDSSRSELENLREKLSQNLSEKKSTIISDLQKLEAFVQKAKDRVEEIDLKIRQANDTRMNYQESIGGDTQMLRECYAKVKLYENSKCPHCMSDLTTDFHKEAMRQYQESIRESEERLQEKKEKKKKIEDVLERMQNAKRDAQRQMHVAESNASTLSSQLKSIEEDDTDEQTESLKRIAEEAKKNIEERQLEKRKTEKKIVFHQMVEEILGEKGVKQMAIKTILPTFNAEISRLVKMMGIEHRVQFDEEFNARITHFGIEVSADTFSTGESNKVDFAVLLSIIRMMKIKYPSLNMLFLDELFSSIDGDGIYHILKILRETVKEYKMNIFVISHYPLAQTEFDYRLEVTKNNGFSSFELEKIR